MRLHVALLAGVPAGPHDAIVEYARRLGAALAGAGHCSRLFTLSEPGAWHGPDGEPFAPSAFDALLLQYNPFAFGHRGRAPWLAPWWCRDGEGRPAQVLVVHEAYVPGRRPRELAIGRPQRRQLEALRPGTDAVMATCGGRVAFLRGWEREVPIDLVPVGSNVTVGVAPPGLPGPPMLACFGSDHPSRRLDLVVAAANAAAAARGGIRLAHLGFGAAPLAGLDAAVEVVHQGPADEDELSRWLHRADLALLPYANGATTNRTTLVAALAHGLPVLSTIGPLTDSVLRAPGVRLLPLDARAYAAEAVRILAAPDELRSMAASARELHRHFAWAEIGRAAGLVVERAVHRRQAAIASS